MLNKIPSKDKVEGMLLLMESRLHMSQAAFLSLGLDLQQDFHSRLEYFKTNHEYLCKVFRKLFLLIEDWVEAGKPGNDKFRELQDVLSQVECQILKVQQAQSKIVPAIRDAARQKANLEAYEGDNTYNCKVIKLLKIH